MNRIRRIRKNKDVTKKKINKIKSTVLKLALVMLNFIFATFAWFAYTMVLDTEVEVNVSAWKVDFKDDNSVSLGESMHFAIPNSYPGMEDYTKEIQIENLGDKAASITFEVQELYILGQEYTVKSGPEAGDNEFTLYYSSEEDGNGNIVIKLLNDSTKFPFEIILTHTDEIYIADADNPNQNKGNFEICFTWPYELADTASETEKTQKDLLDTVWGYDIAQFYNEREAGNTSEAIEITLQAIAKQIID